MFIIILKSTIQCYLSSSNEKKNFYKNKQNWHHIKNADSEVFLKSFEKRSKIKSILIYLLYETNLKKL